MNKLVILCSVILMLSACNGKEDIETYGYGCLQEARAALSRGDFSRARQSIDSLRTHYPKAFNAREEGILVLDSVDLFEAQKQLLETDARLKQLGLSRIARDTLQFRYDEAAQKIKFFSRKLQHDIVNKKIYKE